MTPHIAWAFAQRNLTAAQRVVLIALAERANGERTCFPSEQRLADDCELSRRSVVSAVQYLHTERQLIEVVTDQAEREAILAKAGANSKARVNVYRILRPDDGAKSAHSTNGSAKSAHSYGERAKSAHQTSSDGAKSSSSVCKKQQVECAPFAHEPLIESLNEKKSEGKILSFPEKAVGTPQPTPPTDEFNTWLDGLPPKRSQPLVVGQEVVRGEPVDEDDNPPVDPGVVLAELESLRRSMRMKAYPPRAATLSPDEQVESLCPHRPRVYHLPDAALRAARAELAARAAARGVVS